MVYGATGYTGRLAARAMERAGLSMVLAGRNRESLERLASEFEGEHPIAVARHDEPEALLQMAERGAVLVSTAGPFSEIGELTVAAAVSAGRSYLDTTGEVGFMARTHLRHDRTAREKGVVVVNACAFEYVIGDCAVAIATKDRLPEQVRVSYWLPSKAMTHGTARSMNGVLFSARGDDSLFRSFEIDFPGVGRRWAVTYPGGEREFMRRRHPEVTTSTLMDMPAPLARSAGIMPALAPVLSLGPVRTLVNAAVSRLPAGPDEAQRAKQEWLVLVEVDPERARSGVVVRGVDPYGLTGEILARGAARVLSGRTLASGVVAPSEAFEAESMLDSLADLGVSWERF